MKNNKIIIDILLIGCISLFIFLIVAIYMMFKYRSRLNNVYNKIDSISNYEEVSNNEYASRIPIITLHRVVDHETKTKYFKDDEWVNDLNEVEQELDYLYKNGWKTIDLDEFYDWYNKNKDFDKKTFVITIDDGDAEAYYNVLPLLEKYNFSATLFVIGDAVPEVTSPLEGSKYVKLGMDVIEKLRNENSLLRFESHSYSMHYLDKKGDPVVNNFSIKEIEEDFNNNAKYSFKYFAYPYGYYNNDLLTVISNRKDIKMAFGFNNNTYATRSDNIYEINRIRITSYISFDEFKKWFEYVKD